MKQWLLYPVLATSATAVLHWLVGVSIGFSALIAFIGWPIVGTIVTLDDDLPGSFFNPNGTATPDWLTAEFWGKLFGGGAVVSLAFLAQFGLSAPWPTYLVPAAVLLALISFLLLHRARRSSPHAG